MKPSFFQLPVLKAMENPGEYDIDKDLGDEDVDENKIGRNFIFIYRQKLLHSDLLHYLNR